MIECDLKGMTPLMLAIQLDKIEDVERILEFNEPETLRHKPRDVSALDLALVHTNPLMKQVVLSYYHDYRVTQAHRDL
jgi:hypothetical protein